MKNSLQFKPELLEEPVGASLEWIVQSIVANEGQGSSAYYHLWKGWSESYPETTGYLIETLFDASNISQLYPLQAIAFSCANWLCSLQMPNGAFPGGVGGKLPPIVFDTGMILFGLQRAYEESRDQKYLAALHLATNWLVSQQDDDGVWPNHAFVHDYIPSYYTMVIWAILKANKQLKIRGIEQKLSASLDFFLQKITPQLTIRNWGFRPGEPAFTHTIAYTLQGMLESGILLKRKEVTERVQTIADQILLIRQQKGKLAGEYDENWRGNYSFGCMTGQAQMSILFFRLYEVSGNKVYLNEAQLLLLQMLQFQSNVRLMGWYGGIPGSAPVWGKYQRFRFTNWGAKYFLGACLLMRRHL
ncbi:MAG: hypothetical protein R2830_27350 [Saprospiraceae bacterium]